VAILLNVVLWPGAGQIYNRQPAKGIALIVLTGIETLVFLGLAAWRLLSLLPADLLRLTPGTMFVIVEKTLRSGAVGVAFLVLLLTWVFCIVDAYLVARRLAAEPTSTISR
jgi:hypothetical protein